MTIPKYEDLVDMDDMIEVLRLAAEILDKHRDGGARVPAEQLRMEALAWEHEVMDEWDLVEQRGAEDVPAC
mgnify:FL=1